MIGLKKSYISILHQDKWSYGGSQMWFDNKTLHGYGCGLIAAADLLLYLGEEKLPCVAAQEAECACDEAANKAENACGEAAGKAEGEYSEVAYMEYIERLRRRFTVLPRLGMPGWLLAFQLWLYFLGKRHFCRIWWGCSVRKRDAAIVKMLRADIPVILSIGPNFPFIWGKHKVRLYRKAENGSYVYEQSTNAHYVTVTGIDREWYRISSWGKEYYISRREYAEYVRKHSLGLYSNICHIDLCGHDK